MQFAFFMLLSTLSLTLALPTQTKQASVCCLTPSIVNRVEINIFHTQNNTECRVELTVKQEAKRTPLNVDPTIELDLLNNLCLGIATCNPVTVTNSGNGK
jgi:hypothetical protein